MEILFEEFISAILSADPASFFGRYVRVRSQMTIGRFARDEKNRELFSLRPDIVIGWPVVEAIIDIKYKQLDPGERKMGVSQLDLYQMFAYVTKTGAHRCMLLYPDALVSQARDFFLSVPSSEEENVEIPLMVRAIPLSYDLNSQDGWDTFLKRLREIVRHLVDLPATSLEGELAGVEAS